MQTPVVTFENFTDRARKVMQRANVLANEYDTATISSLDLLQALLEDTGGVAANVLRILCGDNANIQRALSPYRGRRNPVETCVQLPCSTHALKVLEWAKEESRNLGNTHIGTEHLLLGLVRYEETPGFLVLARAGLTIRNVRSEIARLCGTDDSGDALFTGTATRDTVTLTLELIATIGAVDKCLSALECDAGTEWVAVNEVSKKAAKNLADFAYGADGQHPEPGFSYLVSASYIAGFANDVATDRKNRLPPRPEDDEILKRFKPILDRGYTGLVLVIVMDEIHTDQPVLDRSLQAISHDDWVDPFEPVVFPHDDWTDSA